MHELSVAESICRSVAARAGGARVDEMVIEVGALSGVNPDALRFCLGEAARLCGIDLGRFSVEAVPAEAACDCGLIYRADDLAQPCPGCGGFARSFTGGDDVVVTRLVVVEEDEQTHRAGQNRHREG